ncbi:acyl-CoA synthetase (AMP-forming)/AMP-acid ligase II [Corynebacterium mustelae]|uniref:Acyl-CoA synthetase (AMP-forming)/AMP-acid ligase II n=1 Tax=Corynebacterium mustelae TaxID=571915 RepID=A0A0G3GU99_9CORY|nr:o-succinylbenzoate--CoA ligase [Corynebacterium mustelae]AKK04704.1 acyl-CoA synthetase (AMP-forming)/AMP-acid ligase II [Corynebacterium mustelae]
MALRLLEPFPVAAANPYPFLDALEESIASQRTLLPVPADEPARARILHNHMRAGEEISPDIAVVVATSGSTGTPKGAQLTPANLVASADATHHFLGGAGAWLLALPAHHIAGIQVLVRSLVAGIDPIVVDVSQGFHINDFAQAAATLRAESSRCYTSLTPLQLLKAMDTLQGIEALRLFDAILVGGGPLRSDDRRAARDLGISVVSTYGSSETAGGCVYNGQPLAGVTIRVEAERILIAGPMVAAGYRNFPEHEAFSRPGFYLTSDTGYIDNGLLTVTGRIDTIIDSGGLKIHPEVLEQTLLDVPGVDNVCVVGVPDARLGQAIAAAYVGVTSPHDIIAALDELPRWQLPKQLKRVPELPLIGPGKVDRLKVVEFFSSR